MEHRKNLQQHDSDTPVIHKRLITVLWADLSLIHTFRRGNTKVELNSETLLEMTFILPTIRSSFNPRPSRKKKTSIKCTLKVRKLQISLNYSNLRELQ